MILWLLIHFALTPLNTSSGSTGSLRSVYTNLIFPSRSTAFSLSKSKLYFSDCQRFQRSSQSSGVSLRETDFNKTFSIVILSKVLSQSPGFPRTNSLGSSNSLVHKMHSFSIRFAHLSPVCLAHFFYFL